MIHWDGPETRSQVGIGWVLFLLGLTLLGFWVGKWLGEHREAASPPVPEVMQQPLLPVPASAGDEHLKTQEPPLSTPPKRDGIDPLPQQPQRPKEAAPDSVQDTEESWNPPLPKP
jgi:hypothetical protein